MKTIALISVLLFSGCTKLPCEPEQVYVDAKYPRMKTLNRIPSFTPEFILNDGLITMNASELYEASVVSQRRSKQIDFYVKQANEYNRRFVNVQTKQ